MYLHLGNALHRLLCRRYASPQPAQLQSKALELGSNLEAVDVREVCKISVTFPPGGFL